MLLNLVAEMARIRINNKDVAEALNINERTVFNKIHGASEFSFPDTLAIRDTFFPELKLEYLFEQSPETGKE